MKHEELTSNEVEAVNRAEATFLLIRAGYRVYRPEVDCDGEDLVVRSRDGILHPVQQKSRPTVDLKRYGKDNSLWMLFPDPKEAVTLGRKWFLVPHNKLYEWMQDKHGHTPYWIENEAWHDPTISNELGKFLEDYKVEPVTTDLPSYSSPNS
jgi:hypothetical protein